jgi:hypothetical protein
VGGVGAPGIIVITYTPVATNQSGLVGYWPFDGKYMTWASGTTTVGTSTDVSGNGNNGTLVGMNEKTSVVLGKIGQALRFNGTNSYVNIPSATNLNFTATSKYTWSSWINFSGSVSGYKCFLSKDSPGSKGTGFNLCINQTGSTADVIICHYVSATWTCSSGSPSLNLGAGSWNNIVITYDGNSNWGIYKNGNLIRTDSLTVLSDISSKYFIGVGTAANTIQTPGYYWNGSIDDVRVYNRALSATEVKQLYNYGLTTIDNTNVNLTNSDLGPTGVGGSSGLTAYYPFSGQYMTWKSGSNTIGTSTDATGNAANNAKLVNMNRTTSVVAGRSGQALMFDGASSYVQGNPSLITTGATTVCAWIKQSSFVGTENAIVANSKSIFFTSSTNNTLGLTSDGSTNATGAVNAIVNGVWQFVCGTRDSTGNNTNLYVNGTLSGTPNQTSGTPAASSFNTDIGVAGNHISDFFGGSITDVRIYSRVLSATEITQLYSETKGDTVNKSDTGPLTNQDITSVLSTTTAKRIFLTSGSTWTVLPTGTARIIRLR